MCSLTPHASWPISSPACGLVAGCATYARIAVASLTARSTYSVRNDISPLKVAQRIGPAIGNSILPNILIRTSDTNNRTRTSVREHTDTMITRDGLLSEQHLRLEGTTALGSHGHHQWWPRGSEVGRPR